MERVEEIMIRVGRGHHNPGDEMISEWKPTWSPEILLEDYADPPMIYRQGTFVEQPIFSNVENYRFPDPIGDMLLSSHSHEEPYLIPKFYKYKGLKNMDFKYPVDKLVGAFIKMGFADDDAIDVKGVKIVPRDVLMAVVKRPANKFVNENELNIHDSDLVGIMDVSVEGERNGEKVTHLISYRFTDGANKDRQRQIFEAYGTTMVYVALPALIGAKMCVNGEVEHGVISPDSLDPDKFFLGMADSGVSFDFDEVVSRKTVVNR